MRNARRMQFISLLLLSLVWTACTSSINVKPFDDLPRSRQYCRYEITEVKAGTGLNKGDIICVLCSGQQNCGDETEIVEEDGTTKYKVKSLDKGTGCTTCPSGTANPPGTTRQRQ